MRLILPALSVMIGSLTLACEFLPSTSAQALHLAKTAAIRLDSPPRIFQNANSSKLPHQTIANLDIETPELELWPDEPNQSKTYHWQDCAAPSLGPSRGLGAACLTQATVRSAVQANDQGEHSVVFQVDYTQGWPSDPVALSAQIPEANLHRWEFRVFPDRTTQFVGEQGTLLLGTLRPVALIHELTPELALKLAKQYAATLKSPPRIWQDAQIEVMAWSDQPDQETFYEYYNCGIAPIGQPPGVPNPCIAKARLRPVVQPHPQGGYAVTLELRFQDSLDPVDHTWRFWVREIDRVEFLGETDGELLFPRP
ncbi:MAG: hypothetical protein ACRC8A_18395 [Microcoleaceae cyanobacterium]